MNGQQPPLLLLQANPTPSTWISSQIHQLNHLHHLTQEQQGRSLSRQHLRCFQRPTPKMYIPPNSAFGIAAVLSVAIESQVHYGGIIPYHLHINAKDIPTYDLREYVEEAMKFIRMALKETNVLVHWMMGVSRSASMVIWHLMTREKMGLA